MKKTGILVRISRLLWARNSTTQIDRRIMLMWREYLSLHVMDHVDRIALEDRMTTWKRGHINSYIGMGAFREDVNFDRLGIERLLAMTKMFWDIVDTRYPDLYP